MSVVKIAGDVFQDSLVTGVPNIVAEHHKIKKILKMLYLFICVFGFSFQVADFSYLYSTYPTVMETSFPRNALIIKPALTFCNKSPVRRNRYCSKYPNGCEKPENITSFCNHYPYYCKDGLDKMENFSIMPEKKLDMLFKLGKEDLMEMKLESNIFLTHRAKVFSDDAYISHLQGSMRDLITCYRTDYHIDGDFPLSTIAINRDELRKRLIDTYTINLMSEEIVTPAIRPGAMFSVHGPYDPSFEPHILESGKYYQVFVKMEQEKLLPYPYTTDCRNYTEEWISNNKTGPKSKEMCEVLCEKKRTIINCDCIPLRMYKGDAFLLRDLCNRTCERSQKVRQHWDKNVCLQSCKENCENWRYIYTIQEIPTSISRNKNTDGYAVLKLYLQEPSLTRISHKPRCETIELFSYIGGYLGLWLGFSAMAFIDFLHSLFGFFYLTIQQQSRRFTSEFTDKNGANEV